MPIIAGSNVPVGANAIIELMESLSLKALTLNGKLYTVETIPNITLPKNVSTDIVINTGVTPLIIEAFTVDTTSLQIDHEFREDVVFTPSSGTVLTPFNRNRDFKASLLPVDTIEVDPTVVDPGVLLENTTTFNLNGSGSRQQVFASGGFSLPIILEVNSFYLWRATSRDPHTTEVRLKLLISY